MSELFHRPFSKMLTDVFGSVEAADADASVLRVRSVEMTLPIEISLLDLDGEQTFVADLPVWRWRTDFDQPTSRMSIRWEEGAS